MSKAVKGGIALLVLLIFVSAGFAIWSLLENQKLTQEKTSLQQQVTSYEAKTRDLTDKASGLENQAKQLQTSLTEKEKERVVLQQNLSDFEKQIEQLKTQSTQAAKERDDYKNRITTVQQDRDNLKEQISSLRQELDASKNKLAENIEKESAPAKEVEESEDADESEETMAAVPVQVDSRDEGYVAQIIRQKAALEIEVEKYRKDMNESALQVTELKKQNSDLQLEISQLKNEKAEIDQKLKYGEDLANSLSVEAARAKNDQKMAMDRTGQFKSENQQLQSQIKQLTTIKLALERSISTLSDDKKSIEKKLAESDQVIQSRINEIWQVKETLDKRVAMLPRSNEIELPPIIVNANENSRQAPSKMPQRISKKEANIVSINDDNNFVIVDLGEQDGAKIGDVLVVYRGNKKVADLEIIQVRKDIAAADIKGKKTALKVGDVVK